MSVAASSPLTESYETWSRELAELQRHLDAPHGTVVLLRGPRGVGKDRLAEAAIRYAHSLPKTLVLDGRAQNVGGRSFHPFAEMAHQVMHWAAQHGRSEVLVEPEYANLAWVLEPTPVEANATPSLDHKLRFFDSFRALLSGVRRWARPLIVLRDLERADPDSLELASYLADELFADPALDPDRARPGLLLLIARDDDGTPAVARDALHEIASYRHTVTMRLEGLDLEGLRQYLQTPHVLKKLWAASEGLPQALDALLEDLPDNVEDLLLRRLASLDPIAQTTLRALSVSAQPTSARVLARVNQQSIKDVARALKTLCSARITKRQIQDGEFRFAFARRRDLEVVDRSIPTEDRQRYHQGWAQALALDPDSNTPALLAHHYLQSSEPQLGVAHAIQAAESYALGGALKAAVDMLESARPHANGEDKVTIVTRLVDLLPLVDAPQRALRHVAELKSAVPADEVGAVYLREAALHNKAGDYAQALNALGEARRAVPDTQTSERVAIEIAASEAHYHQSNLDDAESAATTGLLYLEAHPGFEPADRGALINQLGKIALARADYNTALRHYDQNLALSLKHNLPHLQAKTLVNISIVHLRRGAHREAERRLDDCIRIARAIGDPPTVAFARMTMGALHHQRGQIGSAIDAYRECRALFRRLGNRTQLARALHNLGGLYLVCGDFARAKAYNDEAFRLAQQSGVGRILALATVVDGLLLAEMGDVEAGEHRLREGMLQQTRSGGERAVEAMVELAEFQLKWRSVDDAAQTIIEVERGLQDHDSPLLRARADLLRGRTLTAAGDESAWVILRRARDAFMKLDRPLFVRDGELALARCALAHGHREAAKLHACAALAAQTEVADTLPTELRPVFEATNAQQEVLQIRAAIEGASGREAPASASMNEPAAMPSPSAETAVGTRPLRNGEAPNGTLRPNGRYDNIIGHSEKLRRVFHILDRIADSEGTVLIQGESGTGKELIAEAVHQNSPRASGPFVKLNCAALVESLLLSELFGHERGSFTGAHERKIGRFESAAGGTLFLDEIGDMSPKTQVALLRVLQEREFERVGGARPIRVDARIVFATNRDLAAMVKTGTFREDLYYRLKGISVELPPLRDRIDDVQPLAHHFLMRYAAENGSAPKRLSEPSILLLQQYDWPGNIRELENIIRAVALFAEHDVIEPRDFDEYRDLFHHANGSPNNAIPPTTGPVLKHDAARPIYQSAAPTPASPSDAVRPVEEIEGDLLMAVFQQGVGLPELKKRLQDQAIARALTLTQGNITRAAEMLGMRRPRLSQIINASPSLKTLAQGVNK